MELLEVDGPGQIGQLNQVSNQVSGGPQAGLSRMNELESAFELRLVVFVAASF